MRRSWFKDCFEHQARGNYLSFSEMIGSVEKVPLVEFQFYFLIFKPEFTWNYDGIMMEFRWKCTDLSMDLRETYQLTLLEWRLAWY